MLQNIITKYGLLNQLNTYAAYGCHTNHIILERNAPLVQTFPTFSYGSMNSQSDNLGFWVIQSFQLFNWFILIMDLNSQLRMNHLKNWRTHMITLRVYGPKWEQEKFRDPECISLFILLVLDKIADNCAGEIRGKITWWLITFSMLVMLPIIWRQHIKCIQRQVSKSIFTLLSMGSLFNSIHFEL
jgi:hypothetical protein